LGLGIAKVTNRGLEYLAGMRELGGHPVKTIDIHQTDLDACVAVAQGEKVVIMRDGNPVALMVGVEGLDEEQIQLGTSDRFWRLITERRSETTLDRAALEKKTNQEAPPQQP
jgi:antitoxin (DNA-binding transcriptional repressor) of toxin-antitoxin stability system